LVLHFETTNQRLLNFSIFFHVLIPRQQQQHHQQQKFNEKSLHYNNANSGVIYPSGPYGDPGYLQMALGAYLTPSAGGYKSVDPYFLSQG
jgi:hypothetical protein